MDTSISEYAQKLVLSAHERHVLIGTSSAGKINGDYLRVASTRNFTAYLSASDGANLFVILNFWRTWISPKCASRKWALQLSLGRGSGAFAHV